MFPEILFFTIKVLNRYFDIVDDFYSDCETENLNSDLYKDKTIINYFLKYFTFHNIASMCFLVSGGIVIVFYLKNSYYEIFLENIQNIDDYLHPKFVHYPSPSIILLKASKSFIFYKEPDIQKILDFRLKRYKDFLKENEEKLPVKNLDELPIKIETIFIS